MGRGLVVVLCLAALGCVTRERDEVVDARDALQECVELHGADFDECVLLRERYHTAVERYETNSRRAWGCNPANEECPRDGSARR